jgi:predicted aldo/keto reductase-like oxidoreductase
MAQGDHDPGALQAFIEAKEAGLIDHIGLTSHGDPSLIRSAIDRIDELETVMFPYNATLAGKEGPEYDYDAVLQKAREEGLGIQTIKGFARQAWPDDMDEDEQPYNTWYEPYDTRSEIEDAIRFALSRGVTTMPTAGEPELLEMMFEAANAYEPMDDDEQAALLERERETDQPVPAP